MSIDVGREKNWGGLLFWGSSKVKKNWGHRVCSVKRVAVGKKCCPIQRVLQKYSQGRKRGEGCTVHSRSVRIIFICSMVD